MAHLGRLSLEALLSAIIATSVCAAGNPDAVRGLVAEHCVKCHEIPGYQARYGRAAVNAPPFQSIADQPRIYTAERLQAFLRQPHFPMTQFILSPSDIDNLIAFIGSLRKR